MTASETAANKPGASRVGVIKLLADGWRHLGTLSRVLRNHGVGAVAQLILNRAQEAASPRRAGCSGHCTELVRGKSGLEVGGPSRAFSGSGLLPLYTHAARIDNCNFSTSTLWEGELRDGGPFRPDEYLEPGTQFVREATDLKGIADWSYDFVCSSHTLEHVANPLLALEEWRRVLRPGGHLLLILPNKAATFDRRRSVTNLEHLIADYDAKIGEDDLTHLEEILEFHDFALDPGGLSVEAFRNRSLENHANRCLHHHVFDLELAVRMVEQARFRVLTAESPRPPDILVLASKAD